MKIKRITILLLILLVFTSCKSNNEKNRKYRMKHKARIMKKKAKMIKAQNIKFKKDIKTIQTYLESDKEKNINDKIITKAFQIRIQARKYQIQANDIKLKHLKKIANFKPKKQVESKEKKKDRFIQYREKNKDMFIKVIDLNIKATQLLIQSHTNFIKAYNTKIKNKDNRKRNYDIYPPNYDRKKIKKLKQRINRLNKKKEKLNSKLP